jgi:hypothetical protein
MVLQNEIGEASGTKGRGIKVQPPDCSTLWFLGGGWGKTQGCCLVSPSFACSPNCP